MAENKKGDPHYPAEYDEPTIMAVRAFHEGIASKDQQAIVRDWLLHAVCRVDDMSFRPGGVDGQRLSDFAEGKRYVANQYRKMLNPITLKAIKGRQQTNEAKASK